MKNLRDRLENWGNWSNSIKKERLARGIEVDLIDARKVFDAIAKLAPPQIEMLTSTFVAMLTPDEICRRLQIPPRPASNFVEAFRKAEDALWRELYEEVTSPRFEEYETIVLDTPELVAKFTENGKPPPRIGTQVEIRKPAVFTLEAQLKEKE
jgi:hypothetical protein